MRISFQPLTVAQGDKTKKGGTMRLGKRRSVFQQGTEWSRFRALYGSAPEIWERHRHRYEVNPELIETLENPAPAAGKEAPEDTISFIGKDEKGERMEIIEVRDHPWFVGVQFHPEYLSRVLSPSKSFLGFFAAASGCLEQITNEYSGRKDLSYYASHSETNGQAA